MTSTVLTIVKLRWSLTLATLRKSVWQAVGFAFSLVLAIGVAAAGGLIGRAVQHEYLTQGQGPLGEQWLMLTQAFVIISGAAITLFVCLVQLMFFGSNSSLSSKRFELYGIADRDLLAGQLAAGLCGIPAISGFAALLLWSSAYAPMGAAPFVMSLIAAPLAIVTMMSLSKMLISLITLLVRSQQAKNVFYVFTILFFVLVCQLPQLLIRSAVQASDVNPGALQTVAAILSWTPFGAGFALPFDAMSGQWWAAVLRVAILVATWVLCFWVGVWCLRRERLAAGDEGRARVVKGIGALSWVPDSRAGAIAARLVTYLKRDPRQGALLLMPIIFVILFALQSKGVSAVAWQSLIWSGWFLNVSVSNGLAYDGRGFAMQVLSGVSGRDDRRGRAMVFVPLEVLYIVVLALALFMFTGDWRRTEGLTMGLTFIVLGVAMSLIGFGLAQITSATLLYPVASLDKPFSSPQGRAMAQGFIPLAYQFGALLLALPTGIAAGVMAFSGTLERQLMLLALIGLTNGVVVFVVGTLLGGAIMDRRMLKIVATLDNFATLQK